MAELHFKSISVAIGGFRDLYSHFSFSIGLVFSVVPGLLGGRPPKALLDCTQSVPW